MDKTLNEKRNFWERENGNRINEKSRFGKLKRESGAVLNVHEGTSNNETR